MFARIWLALSLLAAAIPVGAAPWLAPGDAALRHDVEQLAAAGLIAGPVNAWPLPVAQLCRRSTRPMVPALAAAAKRVETACAAARRDGVVADLGLATTPAVVRGFADAPRGHSDASIALSRRIGRLHLSVGVGQRDGRLHAEPSFAALDLRSWALYGGYVDHWWGPGRENALLLSTNAPPFPKLGIRRTTPAPIDLPLLRALGPIGVDMFAGVLTEDRDDFDNPGLIGMRVAVAPAPGLEIGLNRALQLCGAGRPCSLRLIANGLIGLGNRDNSGTPDEPGNQLAGFDVSYRRRIGAVTTHAYVEMEAEDENNLIVEQFARLAGIELSGAAGSAGASWTLHVEAVDTLAVKLFGGKRYPGSFYNHHIYGDGFRYRGRALGSSLDGDGRLLAISGSLTDADGRRVYATWRNVDLNRSGAATNPLTRVPLSFNQLTGGIEHAALAGRLRLEAQIAHGGAQASGVVPRAQLELSFRISR
jgi:hypothetical protein